VFRSFEIFQLIFYRLRGSIELLGSPLLAVRHYHFSAFITSTPNRSVLPPFYTKRFGKNRPHRRIFVLILSAAGFCSEELASKPIFLFIMKNLLFAYPELRPNSGTGN
jgi:hypothetical protein